MDEGLINSNQNTFVKFKRMDSIDREKHITVLKEKHIKKEKKEFKLKILENLKAGIVVGIVNLPMCIAFASASGTTPEIGVLSGIWAGFIGGLFGGSYYNVIGPAGALIAFLYKFVSRWGPDALPFCCLMTAVFSALCMVFKLGKYVDIFPSSVNEGFTLAVAFSIFFGQISNALGLPPIPVEHHGDHEESILTTIAKQLSHADQMSKSDFLTFLVAFGALMYLSKTKPHIPWIIPVVSAGILLGWIDSLGYVTLGYKTIGRKFGDLSFKIFVMPKIPENYPYMLFTPDFYMDCIPVAFVAILECLISAKIADQVTNTKFNVEREIKGLTYSMGVVGICGGFSGTAALPRTALNIKSGATHKYSSAISSIVLLGLAFFCLPLFKFLPLSVIASMMCFASVKMVNFEEVEMMWNEDMTNFRLLIATFVIGILTDAIIGIFLGYLIYQIIYSDTSLNPYSEVIVYDDAETSQTSNLSSNFCDVPSDQKKYIIYRFVGTLNFMNIEVHKERIFSLAKDNDFTIVLSFRYVNVTDKISLELLKKLIDQIENEQTAISAIPVNMRDDFKDENGDIVVVKIEDDDEHHVQKQETLKGRKIIISGITQEKIISMNDPEFLYHLEEKGQLYLSPGVKIVGSKKH